MQNGRGRDWVHIGFLWRLLTVAGLLTAPANLAQAHRPDAVSPASASASADDTAAMLNALRTADLTLFRIFDRLITKNAMLCDRKAGSAGMLVHSLALYDAGLRDQARSVFAFRTPVAIEGLAEDGPAARAGAAQDDSILSLGGTPLSSPSYDRAQLSALLREIGRQGLGGSLELGVQRGSDAHLLRIGTVPACAALLELRITSRVNATTDGDIVQIDSGLFNLVEGEEALLAAIVAHELAHVVLDHPGRLDRARVGRGMLAGFGRSGRLWRRTESEADLLSVYLLANAGYDPAAAADFWTRYGKRLTPLLAMPTHAGWRDRAEALRAEAAKVRAMPQRPIFPGWYQDRHQPLK